MAKRHERKGVWYQCFVIFLTVFTFFFMIFNTFINFVGFVGQSGFGDDIIPEWFSSDASNLRDKYYVDAVPVAYAFWTTWSVIYFLQWGWVIYVLTSLCRRHESGPVFLNPPVVSPFFLWMSNINIGFNTSWIFLWDNELLIWSYAALVLVWVTLLIAFVDNLRNVDRHDFRSIRILLQNGLAVYLTWITLVYEGDVQQDVSSTITISLFGAIVDGYYILDNIVLERYLRYIYSFWVVAVWALLGIVVKIWNVDRNGLIALVSLIVTAILGLLKIILSIVRTKSNPLYRTEYVKDGQHAANKSYQVDY